MGTTAHAAGDCSDAIIHTIDIENAETDSDKGYYAKFTLSQDDDDHRGWPVAGLGDFNNDGINDFMVGHPDHDVSGVEDQGAAFLVLGPVPEGEWEIEDIGRDVAGYVLTTPSTDDDVWTGAALASGDLDGDGCPDIVISSTGWYRTGYDDVDAGHGRVSELLGDCGTGDFASLGLGGTSVISVFEDATGFWVGPHFGALGGASVSIGNLDDDSADELAIGTPFFNEGYTFREWFEYPDDDSPAIDPPHEGIASLLESPITPPEFAVYHGEDFNDEAGGSVSLGGDFDGDGCEDLLIGAKHAGYTGYTHRFAENPGVAYLVYQPRSATDGSCDGFASLGVDIDLGRIGATRGVEGVEFNGYDEALDGAKTGGWLAFVGDTNGDGYDDIVIGAYGYEEGDGSTFADIGTVYLVYGQPRSAYGGTVMLEGLVAAGAAAKFTGSGEAEKVGVHVSSVGDIDGDGYSDFFIGAEADAQSRPGGRSGTTGHSYLVYGRPGWDWSGEYSLRTLTDTEDDHIAYFNGVKLHFPGGTFSESGNVGDITGNGYGDIVITSAHDEDSNLGGMFYVIEGSCRDISE